MPYYINHVNNEGILGIIRRACNCVDSRLMDHGFRVSYIVSGLIRNLGIFDEKKRRDACILALLHDIGAYKMESFHLWQLVCEIFFSSKGAVTCHIVSPYAVAFPKECRVC